MRIRPERVAETIKREMADPDATGWENQWVGAGGEKLDRQGVAPTDTVRAQKPDEDLLPRYLDELRKRMLSPEKKVP